MCSAPRRAFRPETADRYLWALYQRVQLSKGNSPEARLQRNSLQKLSFMVDLLHYYENQATEAPDVIFAQRLPALIEQLVVSGPTDPLDPKLIVQAETLLGGQVKVPRNPPRGRKDIPGQHSAAGPMNLSQ